MDIVENDHEYHRAVKNNAEREKLLALYCNKHSLKNGMASPIKHQWQTHTSAQFTVPTGEHNSLSGAEVNRIENRVTKVFCTHCLEVKDI
jgi:hypothetical protein